MYAGMAFGTPQFVRPGIVPQNPDTMLGVQVAKSGQSSGYTTGTVSAINTELNVFYNCHPKRGS
ncbi:MAG TPA: hypothetical protein VGK99_17570 [Acidobacteriota bacterium]|jgi:hypothetical protein